MIAYNDYLKEFITPAALLGKPITFPRIMEDMIKQEEEILRNDIKTYLEEIDLKFRNSPERTKRYYISYTKPRRFITMAGEITITRTIYKDRTTNKHYYYLEEKLGINKRQRYTNDVACYAAEAYSDENSMIKVGNEVGNLIHSKFSLSDNRAHSISRASIANMIKRVKTLRIESKMDKKEVDDLYILLDEKYLPDHPITNSKGITLRNPTMVKSALIVEGLDKTRHNRHSYINPSYYSSYDTDFTLNLIKHIDNNYNIDKIKHINFLADGANWIKATAKDITFQNSDTTFYLDRFHFHQAIWRVTRNDDIYLKAINYLYHDDSDNLFKLLDTLNKTNNDNINVSYIKNNYDYIQNTIHLKNMNCAMEQCIHHHIHSEFDNVPKVYSKKNINIYLSMRDNYRNNENIKLLYLEGLNDKSENDTSIISKYSNNNYEYSHSINTLLTAT